jgi:hypothetical protein
MHRSLLRQSSVGCGVPAAAYDRSVKPWNFDPTKWIIWTFSKLGFTRNLRRVPQDKILLAQQRRKAEIDFRDAPNVEGNSLPRITRIARI